MHLLCFFSIHLSTMSKSFEQVVHLTCEYDVDNSLECDWSECLFEDVLGDQNAYEDVEVECHDERCD